MKAVVVELKKNHVAVLSDDGCITTIKNENYEIGQVIQLRMTNATLVKKLTTIAASAAAILLLGTGTWAYASPYSYVSVDVNPSIEFTINRFDRVLKVNAVNDDGEKIINEIVLDNLTNSSIENAIIKTVDQMTEAGYFNDEQEDNIVITTSSENTDKAQALAQEIQGTVEQETNNEVIVEAFSVEMDRVQEAKALGTTPGKLNLVEKLIEISSDPTSMNVEEWLNKPVKEIMKATKEAQKSVKKDALAENATIDTENSSGDENNNLVSSEADTDNNKDKSLELAEKEVEKAQKEAAKAEEKAIAAQAKAEKKAKDAALAENTKKAVKAEKEAKKAKDAAKEALKAAEKAQKDVEKAQKDAEKAQKAAEKAQKDAEKAKKDVEKAKKDDINTSSNKEAYKTYKVTPVPDDIDNDTNNQPSDTDLKNQEKDSKNNSGKNKVDTDNKSTDNSESSTEEKNSKDKSGN